MAGGGVYLHCSSFPPDQGRADVRRRLGIILRTPKESKDRGVKAQEIGAATHQEWEGVGSLSLGM